MTLQVHDELVFEVPEAEMDGMRSLVREQMESAHQLSVPLMVEIGVGKNWQNLE
jgi:DNA polymerase-1